MPRDSFIPDSTPVEAGRAPTNIRADEPLYNPVGDQGRAAGYASKQRNSAGEGAVAPQLYGAEGEKKLQERRMPRFKKGTKSVPKTEVAVVHKGEAIIPADQNPDNPANNPPDHWSRAGNRRHAIGRGIPKSMLAQFGKIKVQE
jgi:hypothetical protein